MNKYLLACLIVLIVGGVGVAGYLLYQMLTDPVGPTSVVSAGIALGKDVASEAVDGFQKGIQTGKESANLMVGQAELAYNITSKSVQNEVSTGIHQIKDVGGDLASTSTNAIHQISKAPVAVKNVAKDEYDALKKNLEKGQSQFVESLKKPSEGTVHGIEQAGKEIGKIGKDSGKAVGTAFVKGGKAATSEAKKIGHALTDWL